MNELSFRSRLVKKERLTDDTIIVGFEAPPDFSFKAGQFFQIVFGSGEGFRPYSFLNPPSLNHIIESYIRLIPGGYGSGFLKKARLGDEFLIKGPLGTFLFDESQEDNVFIASGAGITPIHSMLVENVPKFPDMRFTLIYGARTMSDLAFHQEFLALSQKYPNFSYIATLTREDNEDLPKGRVQQHIKDFKGKTFYICGLKELIKDVVIMLRENGVANDDIKFERYD